MALRILLRKSTINQAKKNTRILAVVILFINVEQIVSIIILPLLLKDEKMIKFNLDQASIIIAILGVIYAIVIIHLVKPLNKLSECGH